MEVEDNLYCITTGSRIQDVIKDDLLHWIEDGQKLCQEFVDGCFKDSLRFENPIPRRKINTFNLLPSKVQ